MTHPDPFVPPISAPGGGDGDTPNTSRKLIAWRDGKAIAVTPEEAEELLREGL